MGGEEPTGSPDFGKLLRSHRLSAGLSQEALAERARMSTHGISALERGYRHYPHRETLALLIGALRLTDKQRLTFEQAATRPALPRKGPTTGDEGGLTTDSPTPLAITSFVGRSVELRELSKLASANRLVTLTGPGGVGKTQTALRVANAICAPGERLFFVSLGAVSDSALVNSTVASALGAPQIHNRTWLDTVITWLRDQSATLVLDNCEHVIATAAELAQAVASACPRVRVLATSREPLRVAGESVYRLPSLEFPLAGNAHDLSSTDARAFGSIELFVDRARSVDFHFNLTNENIPLIAEICRRLDGIPLAIELAAARTSSLSIATLASKLDARFRILSGGDRNALPRQKTMRAAIDWSYSLLSATERLAFDRLCVFVAGCTLESAVTVCGDSQVPEERVLDLLGSLLDKSLLARERGPGESRYYLLESFREYGLEQLESRGEDNEASCRHAGAIALLLQECHVEWELGPHPDWLFRYERDLPNVRAAFSWAIGADPELAARIAAFAAPLFLRLSLLDEGVGLCERALGVAVAIPGATEAPLRHSLSMLYNNLGRNDEALSQAFESAARYRELGEPRGLARALSQIANQSSLAGRFDDAGAAANEALKLVRELGDRRLLAATLRRCATSFGMKDASRMRAMYSECAMLFRSLGQHDDTARALQWWAVSEAVLGNYSEAVKHLTEAKQLAGEELAVAIAGDIVACSLSLGAHERVGSLAREALRLAAKSRHPIHLPFAISYVSALAQRCDAAQAARLWGYAWGRIRDAGWQPPDYERELAERTRSKLTDVLGETTSARYLAEGATLSEGEAVTRATALCSGFLDA